MKPDPEMMRQAQIHATDALRAIGDFQLAAQNEAGTIGSTHYSAYWAVRALAERLQSASSKLFHVALDTDERLTPASRMQQPPGS